MLEDFTLAAAHDALVSLRQFVHFSDVWHTHALHTRRRAAALVNAVGTPPSRKGGLSDSRSMEPVFRASQT